MSTPLLEAANRYLDRDCSRFHMPGHKGAPLPALGAVTRYDLTEVQGLDSLYHADGPIADLERRYSALYGTAGSLLSAGGSTLCIQAMLALACPPGAKLLAARGVHTAAVNAMALLDLRPVWIYPDCDLETGLASTVSPKQVRAAVEANPDCAAVCVTSPTLTGQISDIAAISAICHRQGIPLLVDNAHGAHLRFLSPSLHPIGLGADLCCDSLHKTLPVLTGGALLHVGNPACLPRAKERMALFGSTSPSYPVMLSADLALDYIASRLPGDLFAVGGRLRELSRRARDRGFLLPAGSLDPLRLTLGFSGLGYRRGDFAGHLAHCRVEPEYLSDHLCVLMAGGGNTARDFDRLRRLIEEARPRSPLAVPPAPPRPTPAVLTLRQAMFAQARSLPVDSARGHIASGMVTPCPPGVPLVVGGEMLSPEIIASLKNSGILHVNVIK